MSTKTLSQIKGFLVDMDGTVYLSNNPLPGAVDFFQYLDAQEIPHLFFSNHPNFPASTYVEKLTKLEIPATEEQVITSTYATILYLQEHNIKSVYAVGTPGFEQQLIDAGIAVLPTADADNADALVVSCDLTLTYEKLKTASLLLRNKPELPYISTNPDFLYPTAEGPLPDAGSIMALLEASNNRVPVVIGKPHEGMVHMASERLSLKPEEMAIIGDRLYTDMRMGHDFGMTTILVLSGEANKEDIAGEELQPDYVFNNLGEVLEELRG